MDKLRQLPDWREWKRKAIAKAAWYDDLLPGELDDIGDFKFPAEIERQHELVMSYLALSRSRQALDDLEYYFRRYPFSKLPISKDEHLKNMGVSWA